jgi:large repetitive protein
MFRLPVLALGASIASPAAWAVPQVIDVTLDAPAHSFFYDEGEPESTISDNWNATSPLPDLEGASDSHQVVLHLPYAIEVTDAGAALSVVCAWGDGTIGGAGRFSLAPSVEVLQGEGDLNWSFQDVDVNPDVTPKDLQVSLMADPSEGAQLSGFDITWSGSDVDASFFDCDVTLLKTITETPPAEDPGITLYHRGRVTVDPLVTNSQTPQLSGTANLPGTTQIDVEINGATWLDVAVLNGVWDLDTSTEPSVGTLGSFGEYNYNVMAEVTVDGEQLEIDQTTNELIIDLSPPNVTMPLVFTDDTSPMLYGTVDDDSTVVVNVAGEDFDAVVANGVWTLADGTFEQSAGVVQVTVTATDPAGNEASTGNDLVIEIFAPSASADVLITNQSAPDFTGTVTSPYAMVGMSVAGQTLSGINMGDGTWIAYGDDLAGLNEGSYDLAAWAVDPLGRSDGNTRVDGLTVDTSHPVLSLDEVVTNVSSPGLSGDLDDTTAEVSVTVGGQSYASYNKGDGTWFTLAFVISALSDGVHTATVSATDAAGNTSTASNTITVDTVGPSVGLSQTVTNDPTPALSGTIDDDYASVWVEVEGVDYEAVNYAFGFWSLANDTIASLDDGTIEVIVTATDVAGNVGGTTFSLEVDTDAPAVTVDELATTESQPPLTGTVDDYTATVEVSIDSVTQTAVADGTGRWWLAPSISLSEGLYDVVVTATDEAGNEGYDDTTDELLVDFYEPLVTMDDVVTGTTSPGLTGTVNEEDATVTLSIGSSIFEATNNQDGTWSVTEGSISFWSLEDGVNAVLVTAEDGVGNKGYATAQITLDYSQPVVTADDFTTNDTSPPISGTVDDADATVVVSYGDVDHEATVGLSGEWSLPDNTIGPISEGLNWVSVEATNELGNIGSKGFYVTVDLTAPVVSVVSVATNEVTSIWLTGQTDGFADTVWVCVDESCGAAATDGNGGWTVSATTLASIHEDGVYDVVVTATDAAGNEGTDEGTITVDQTPPVLTVDDLETDSQSPTLTGTVGDPDAKVSLTIDGVTALAVNDGAGGWSASLVWLQNGLNVVAAYATDTAGNQAVAFGDIYVTLEGPDVSVDTLVTNDSSPALTGSIDNLSQTAGLSLVVVEVDGVEYEADVDDDLDWSVADDAMGPLDDDVYDVTVTAYWGGESTITQPGALTIDTVAPVVFVDSVTTNEANPRATGTVDDPDAYISVEVDGGLYLGNVDGAGFWSASVSSLPDGNWNLNVTAVDLAGNIGVDGTTDELTVDTTAPVVTIEPVASTKNKPELNGTVDDAGATLAVWLKGIAYDIENPGNGTWTLASGTVAPLPDGSTTATLIAMDALGNLASAATEVVVDKTAPVVTVDSLVTDEKQPELTGWVDDVDALVQVTVDNKIYTADVNADGTWVLAAKTLDKLSEGTWDVKAEATDDLGNAGTDDSVDELVVDFDADDDGLTDAEEASNGTDPLLADTDGDCIDDGDEVDLGTDPTRADTDGDGLDDLVELGLGTDATDSDTDSDGLDDGEELLTHHTDPLVADTDGDGRSDGDEVLSDHTNPNEEDTDGDGVSDGDEALAGTDPLEGVQDADSDGLTDAEEEDLGTNPDAADSDGDGLWDLVEVLLETDPNDSDSDDDGVKDGAEVLAGTDPNNADTDGDGLIDGDEVDTDALDDDSDNDGLMDGREVELGTDPNNADTDKDGRLDGQEVLDGTDPLVADDAVGAEGATAPPGSCATVGPTPLGWGPMALFLLLGYRRSTR